MTALEKVSKQLSACDSTSEIAFVSRTLCHVKLTFSCQFNLVYSSGHSLACLLPHR